MEAEDPLQAAAQAFKFQLERNQSRIQSSLSIQASNLAQLAAQCGLGCAPGALRGDVRIGSESS